jgi:predicted TIM-barrel fold metal-dependent hydrolase
MRNPGDLATHLYQRISDLWVIDSHEHLPDEATRLTLEVDAVSLWENYPRFDLQAAGMTDVEFAAMVDRGRSLEERWAILRKWLPLIRHTSVSRATFLGLKEFYGYEDITDDNYEEISRVMQAANKPGIYRRAFHDCGRILVALNQVYMRCWNGLPAAGNFRLPQMWEAQFNVGLGHHAFTMIEAELGRSVSSLESYVGAVAELLALYRARGVLGIKLDKPTIQSLPAASDVAPLFERAARLHDRGNQGGAPLSPAEQTALRDYLAHAIIRIAGEVGLVIIQHSGHRGMWKDYRLANPMNLIPVFMLYPKTRFEVYHAGAPWVREAGMMVKTLPNVWLNLCWAHSLAREIARSALDEWLDLVPANKIIAFGGDTFVWIEWTLGDLVLSRQNVALALAKRMSEGLLTEDQAVDLARRMFFDNPKSLYGLRCSPGDNVTYE